MSYLHILVAPILSTLSVVFDQAPQRFLAQHVACATTHVALLHEGPGGEEEVGMLASTLNCFFKMLKLNSFEQFNSRCSLSLGELPFSILIANKMCIIKLVNFIELYVRG